MPADTLMHETDESDKTDDSIHTAAASPALTNSDPAAASPPITDSESKNHDQRPSQPRRPSGTSNDDQLLASRALGL